MLGTIVNTGTILAGTVLGSVLKKGIKEQYQETMFNAMGFAAVALGINAVVKNMGDSRYPVLFILSLAIGSLAGTMMDLNGKFNRLASRFSGSSDSKLGQGLSTGILLFCVGTLSILGPHRKRCLRRQYLFVYQRHSGFCDVYGAGVHLWHRNRVCSGCPFLLAGRYLCLRRFSQFLSDP